MSKVVAEEYLSSLTDLTVNSKPLINMLTMLADENVDHAPAIVQVIENHLEKVPPEVKLPILYLIDSIIKNVSKVYVPLFTQNIVNVFVSVFEKVDERTRLNMYKLRQTWADVFPARKLYVLDLRVKDIDHAWPVTAPTPTSIHFNPKFLGSKSTIAEVSSGTTAPPQVTTPVTTPTTTQSSELSETVLREQLLKKQKILIELQQKKLELQLMQTKAVIEGQENQPSETSGQPSMQNLVRPPLNEETAKLISQRATAKPKAVVIPPSNISASKLKAVPNPGQNKTKIAPANTQLIEAAKSRDPRIARQQQQSTVSEVTHKEQEIYNRQLAMLKTPVVEQVAPVVPAQKIYGDSSVKSHITFNVQGSLEKERLDAKNKKQIKESLKIEVSSKNKSKQNSSKDLKSSPNKGSKGSSSKDSKNLSNKDTQRKNHSDRSKTPPKNERSVSPGSVRNDSKRPHDSNNRQSRPHTSKTSPKKPILRSPRNSPSKYNQNSDSYSPKNQNSSASENASIHSFNSKKSHKKFKKKHKEDGTTPLKREINENSLFTGKYSLPSRVEEVLETVHLYSPTPESKDKSPVGDSKPCLKLDDKDFRRSPEGREVEKKEKSDNVPQSTVNLECVQKDRSIDDSIKEHNSEDFEVTICDKNKKPDKSVSLDLELIESSPSPEPPPPPIISRSEENSICEKKDDLDYEEFSEEEKESQKEVTGFKDVKGVSKGRNYMRRNRELSASPQEVAGDVDLRVGGPPEKQPRLLFEEEKTTVIESKKLLSESLVNVSGKDVDLRLLTVRSGSPTAKRLSTETPIEEPPKKKNKSEMFDELFGSEDVDLRKITRGVLNSGDQLPSPPPPPVISNGPGTPQIATIAPLVVGENAELSLGDTSSEFPREDSPAENALREREFDSNRSRFRKSWAEIKVKPEAEIKPMTLSTQLELEIGQRKDLSFSGFDSPEKGTKKHLKERPSPRGELDRLGRPLLYNKLPNDPRARRESLGVLDGRDTDMRRLGGLMDRDLDTKINVNMIIAQAAEQVRNGTMSLQEYNELLKQVIHVNEKQKLREAQNKSRQEIRRSQHHHRNRRSPNRFGPHNRNSPPFRHDDDRRERRPFNDIDERLQMPWGNIQQHSDSGPGFNRIPYSCGLNRTPFDMSNFDERTISTKSDVWEEDSNRFRRLNDLDSSDSRLRDVMCNERTHDCVDVPPADLQVLELIAKDPMKSINIDGTARDIRFYGDTAVVMLSWNDPKEISFEDGLRRVLIGDLSIVCALNDPYIMFMLNGNPHRIRLGAPTRELYIDGEFYEAHFGGPPVQVQIDGLSYLVQLEGPPPQVKIGKKRTDLICGRVNMIVDASAILPLYLDAKPQRFDLRSRPYVFRLVNNLKTLLVNEIPVDIQFGGGCRQICGYGNLHFLRLSMLPNGIEPGRVQILNMENLGVSSVSNVFDATVPGGKTSPPVNNVQQNLSVDVNSIIPGFDGSQLSSGSRITGVVGNGPLDILTSLISGATTPEQSVGFNYQVENKETQQSVQPSATRPETEPATSQTQPSNVPLLGSGLNINDLFQRLVATGIVPTLSTIGNNQKTQNESTFKPVDFSDSNSLRERQPPIINLLYSGIQCSSCGVRFSPEETVKYSRHLDWHFRQNRREKDAARKGQSRKWYYDVSDWIQFEEIEDLEERAQSWFEAEATNNGEENNDQQEIKSVPAPHGQDFTLCELCRDEFETYYNEEKEEWHLKPCILVENRYYHPVCYEDLMNMPEDSLLAEKTSDAIVPIKNISVIENVQILEEIKDKYVSEAEKIKSDSEEEECIELKIEKIEDNKNCSENSEEIIGKLLNELIKCIEFKNQMELEESEKEKSEEDKEKEKEKEEEEEEEEIEEMEEIKEAEKEEEEEEEIEVLASVSVNQKKKIIDVDLIEKIDDEDDVVYQRKTPSPIILIPPAKIKQEPVDEMESPVAVVDQTYTNVVSSIDGNVEMIDAPQVAPSAPSRIKITFNKPIATEQNTEKQIVQEVPDSTAEETDPDPLPLRPKKPRIAEREMTVYLPVVKGTEESGLCSIM